MNLIFDDESHSYYCETGKLPSVTSVLVAEGVVSFPFCPGAMERGTLVHSLCALLDGGEAKPDLDPSTSGYLASYARFCAEYKPSWSLIEKALGHPVYNYAGTLDRFAPLLDIKTGAPGSGEPLQLGAYWELLKVNGYKPKPEGMFLYLGEDGTYRIETVKDLPRLAKIFLSVLATHNYKKERK